MPSFEAELQVYWQGEPVFQGALSEELELGRQGRRDHSTLYQVQHGPPGARLTIAPRTNTDLSRRLVRLVPVAEDRVEATNVSSVNRLSVDGESALKPGETRTYILPVRFAVFESQIVVSYPEDPGSQLLSLASPASPPSPDHVDIEFDLSASLGLADQFSSSDAERLHNWLVGVTKVLQAASGSKEFNKSAARQLVGLIGFDRGQVLTIEPGQRWTQVAVHERGNASGVATLKLNHRLLAEVLKQRRTLWEARDASTADGGQRTAAVASPILDESGEVIGALYGDRRSSSRYAVAEISKLEAMLVEALAGGVAAGRARLRHEREAAQARVRFEQFFTTELSQRLAATPDLLTCRDTEVTLLFCDIRRFSNITEALGPEQTMEWIRQVMGELADCAANHDGVLVDFIGDELMIMWGAPTEQPDHAARACRAALEMSHLVRELDDRWRDVVGQPTELGFGINTGVARVGNVGLERKFRYAPFGASVNLASRLQDATKHFGVDILISESTRQAAGDGLLARRLGRIQVMNIVKPVDVFELLGDDDPTSCSLCLEYEAALAAFETGSLAESLRGLSSILDSHPNDGPSLLLLSRVVELLRKEDRTFDPVLELPSK
ncbi:Adenylate cyclase 1 [Pirellulimonas nuda]|uniref:Adenylate cyclase 1 n=1 Tax=Pirellulimonas nuda TaxID=2528009 RepID=A0A518DAI9_9BACT|nr:adenylate/guanylate cyclase domain-containing protein [Pirellulimonas nuda]QDU88489.1 Adenylate cyclase 1 [Pirellulimonas nuda]